VVVAGTSYTSETKRICGSLGGFSSREREVKRTGKAPMASRGFSLSLSSGLELLTAGEGCLIFLPQILHWRLAPFPCTSRGWKLRSSNQRMTWCLEKRTFDSIRTWGISPRCTYA